MNLDAVAVPRKLTPEDIRVLRKVQNCWQLKIRFYTNWLMKLPRK